MINAARSSTSRREPGRPVLQLQLPPPTTISCVDIHHNRVCYICSNSPLSPLPPDEDAPFHHDPLDRALDQPMPLPALTNGATYPSKEDAYVKPNASVFDAAYAVPWFPNLPSVPQDKRVIDDFSQIEKRRLPALAWSMKDRGALERMDDAKFDSTTAANRCILMLPEKDREELIRLVENRERGNLARRREEVKKFLEQEDAEMGGIDPEFEHSTRPVGPEGTEIDIEEW